MSGMRATVRIDEPGELTTDAFGDVHPTNNPVYLGPAHTRYPGLAFEKAVNLVGAEAVVSRLVVRIPFPESGRGEWFVAPPVVRPGQVVTVVDDRDTPQLVGTRLRIASIDDQSRASSQRLICEDFQSGVA